MILNTTTQWRRKNIKTCSLGFWLGKFLRLYIILIDGLGYIKNFKTLGPIDLGDVVVRNKKSQCGNDDVRNRHGPGPKTGKPIFCHVKKVEKAEEQKNRDVN